MIPYFDPKFWNYKALYRLNWHLIIAFTAFSAASFFYENITDIAVVANRITMPLTSIKPTVIMFNRRVNMIIMWYCWLYGVFACSNKCQMLKF